MLSEEQVERAVSVSIACLVDNALLPGMSAGDKGSDKGSDKGGRKSGKSGASGGSSASSSSEMLVDDDEDYVDGKEGRGSGGDKGQSDNLEAMVTVGKSKFKVKQSTRRLLAEVEKPCPPSPY